MTLTFNEALDGNSEPAATAFTVTVSGNARAVESVDVSGSAATLTLASAVSSEDTVTVSYTAPASESVDRLRDEVGNAAASFAGRSVTNDTAPPPPLTASIHDAPESHNGQDAFTFELQFSEEFKLSYKTLRDHAFTEDGGTVTRAKRITKGSNLCWEITVKPDCDADVIVVLPITEDCDAEGGQGRPPIAQPPAATGPPQAADHRRVGLRAPGHHRRGTALRGLQPTLVVRNL